MSAVALIPARGGSKRLPRKNVIDFFGRPIIAYTIEAALESKCFERVVVSTEDDEIIAVAERCGAVMARRSAELATDSATVVDVCIDFLDREAAAGRHWKTLACLYATAPLRNAADVRGTMSLLEPAACAFAMAVTVYDLQPYAALKFASDNSLSPMWPDLIDLRPDQLPPMRVDNGSTYAVGVEEFRLHRTFYGPNLRGHEMPRERSVDIDTQSDLDVALWYARALGICESHLSAGGQPRNRQQ